MATNAQIWAYYILMTSTISIYGHKRDKDMGTNGACPNMDIPYTDDDIPGPQGRGQGFGCNRSCLSRSINGHNWIITYVSIHGPDLYTNRIPATE